VVAGSLVAFMVDEGDRKRLARHFSHDPRRSLRDNVLWVKGSVGGEVVAVVGGNHPLAERVLHPSPPVAASLSLSPCALHTCTAWHDIRNGMAWTQG
jgi:hypothetical protein